MRCNKIYYDDCWYRMCVLFLLREFPALNSPTGAPLKWVQITGREVELSFCVSHQPWTRSRRLTNARSTFTRGSMQLKDMWVQLICKQPNASWLLSLLCRVTRKLHQCIFSDNFGTQNRQRARQCLVLFINISASRRSRYLLNIEQVWK